MGKAAARLAASGEPSSLPFNLLAGPKRQTEERGEQSVSDVSPTGEAGRSYSTMANKDYEGVHGEHPSAD